MFKWLTVSNHSELPAPMTPLITPYTYYTVGPTNNERIRLKIGNSSIDMTKLGVESLIALLQVAMTQLPENLHEEEKNEKI